MIPHHAQPRRSNRERRAGLDLTPPSHRDLLLSALIRRLEPETLHARAVPQCLESKSLRRPLRPARALRTIKGARLALAGCTTRCGAATSIRRSRAS